MMRNLVRGLSSSIYKLFRKHDIPLPRETFQKARIRSAAKSEWGEAKVALLQEISASNNSSVSRLFNRKLLERIEELEKTTPVPAITHALFRDRSTFENSTDRTVSSEISIDEDFTESQNAALLKGRENRVLFLLGAPGSGKTRVISHLISDYVGAGQTTLLCCHTKAALNHALSHLDDETRSSLFFRSGTFGALVIDDQLPAFDNVVIDEAGMAHIAYVLYLSGIARQRMVFAGDPMQLGPIATFDGERSPWVRQNIFQHQSGTNNLSELYAWQEKNQDISVLLREQFEVPERIFNVINHFCYGNRLSCRSQGRGLISVIDTSQLDPALIGGQRSPVNSVHGEIVMGTLEELLSKQSITADDIGVMTPFRGQSHHLKQLGSLRELPDTIEYGTVHTFQGRMKTAIVLDLTVSGVDHPFKVLADDNQAMGLMNAALSRCRTRNGIEGRLVVIANLEHINTHYPNGAVDRFLNRLVSTADSLSQPTEPITADHRPMRDDVQRYAQVTQTLVQAFEENYHNLSEALESTDLPDEAEVEAVIWNAYDLIPRLIRLCNRLKASGEPDWFRVSDDNLATLEQPVAALELSNLSEEARFNPGRISHFRAVISDLYMVIYESSMSKGETGKNLDPPRPVFDPDAYDGESYGRIRIWLKELRNYYEHDTSKWEERQRQANRTQRDLFCQCAVNKSAPEISQDYSSLEYLRATLFALKEVISYLDAVRNKLKESR